MNTKSRPRFETTDTGQIEVSLLGSGWAAIHTVTVYVHDDGPDSGVAYSYPDIQQTGIDRYRTRAEAVIEARQWSESDEIPLAKGLEAEPVNPPPTT